MTNKRSFVDDSDEEINKLLDELEEIEATQNPNSLFTQITTADTDIQIMTDTSNSITTDNNDINVHNNQTYNHEEHNHSLQSSFLEDSKEIKIKDSQSKSMETEIISQVPRPFFCEQGIDHDSLVDNLNWIYSQYSDNIITTVKDIVILSSSSTLRISLLIGMLKVNNHNNQNRFYLIDCESEIPLLLHDALWNKYKIRPYTGLFIVVKDVSIFRGHVVIVPRNILGIYQNDTL